MEFSRNARVFVAGHTGLVGSAIWRELNRRDVTHIITRTRAELELLDAAAVRSFYRQERPEYVFVAAATVGGILANDSCPAQFLYENLQIQNNLIHGAYRASVKKLLFLGSSCIYPKTASQPLREDCLLTGPLESTNQWYAVAKIAGLMLCQAYRRQYGCNFICGMPTNIYGIGDNYDVHGSHVVPALIRRFHEAKVRRVASVTCWGTGKPLREFLYADDLARACVFLMGNYDQEEPINIGSGEELSIQELAQLVGGTIGFDGEILWDSSKPDCTPRKRLDGSRLFNLGWRPNVDLRIGIQQAYDDFLCRFPLLKASPVVA
jgi:GDP-L-fucose synthase